jgi:hypothetical protein
MIESMWRGFVGTMREAHRQSRRLAEVVGPKRSTPEGERLIKALGAAENVFAPFVQTQAAALTQAWAARYLAMPEVIKGIDDARIALNAASPDTRTILTTKAPGAKFSDGFEYGMLEPVLVLLRVLPAQLRDPRSKPSAVQIAVAMKKIEPALSVRKAAESVGITEAKLQRHDLWRAAARMSSLTGKDGKTI